MSTDDPQTTTRAPRGALLRLRRAHPGVRARPDARDSTVGRSRRCATASATSLEERGSGLVLRNVAGGWRLYTHPDTAPVVERFVLSSRQARLTKAALETLAIVAYKQPVTRHQVSGIRGVNSDGVLRALVDRGLIEEAGRDETPGPAGRSSPPRPSSSSASACPRSPSLPSLAPLLGIDEVAEAEGTLAGPGPGHRRRGAGADRGRGPRGAGARPSPPSRTGRGRAAERSRSGRPRLRWPRSGSSGPSPARGSARVVPARS